MHPLRSAAHGALLCAALAGSAIAAAPTADQAAQFKVGEATLADVTAAFGKPMTKTTMGGKVVVSYGTVTAHVKAQTFIPIVGLFAGGGTTKAASATFIFGDDGKLLSTVTSDSVSDCSSAITGISCK